MIPRSRLAKALSAAAALAVSGGAMAVGPAAEQVEIAGGAAPAEARFGTSFADLSAGTLSGEAPSERLRPVQAVDPVEAPSPPDEARVRPTAPESAVPATPSEIVEPVPAEPAIHAAPTETVTGKTPDQGDVVTSRRPPPRSERMAREAAPDPARSPRGTADRSARAGEETGRERVGARSADTGRGTTEQAGTSAASSYPGEVMARLSGVRRPAVRARGAATVAFAVDATGGLARAAIARSSGSRELDRAALALVRRAAPFPAPPQGARRDFSIRIAGR